MNDTELREVPFASEDIYKGVIIHAERWQVRCPNGMNAVREIILHNGAAAVVPLFEDGTVMLVRQHRVAIDEITLEVPAGKLDAKDEPPLHCAIRELKEETGLTAARMTVPMMVSPKHWRKSTAGKSRIPRPSVPCS